MFVSFSLTVHLEKKKPWNQTPSRKKKAVVFKNVMANAYQDQLNDGLFFFFISFHFTALTVWHLKYVQEFYVHCGDISTTLNMTHHKMKRDWLLYLSVKWPLGLVLTI